MCFFKCQWSLRKSEDNVLLFGEYKCYKDNVIFQYITADSGIL